MALDPELVHSVSLAAQRLESAAYSISLTNNPAFGLEDNYNQQAAALMAILGITAEKVSFTNIGINAAVMTLLSKARQTVSVDDYFRPDLGDINYTQAFARAQEALLPRGGGEVLCPNSQTYEADRIELQNNCVIVGRGIGATEIKQRAGVNQDFVISANFHTVVNTGVSAITDPLVPYWFGMSRLRINGNKFVTGTNPTGNTSGRGLCAYGPAMVFREVMVTNTAGDGIFTQYTDTPNASDWRGQEEAQFDNITVRDAGGHGWLFQGPHNSKMNGITCGFNGLWGFRSETAPGYGGGIDWIGSIHTYANGRATSPAQDTGCYFGEIVRVGTVVTDGDNLVIAGSNCQIGSWRLYNAGGQTSSVISGGGNSIGSINGNVWDLSVDQVALTISGSSNQIGTVQLTSNNPSNDGIVITGNSNKIGSGFVTGFSNSGKKGLWINGGSKNHVVLEIAGCATCFHHTPGTNNYADIECTTNAGQLAVGGSIPGVTDRFNIRSSGTVAGGTFSQLQTATFPMDITTVQTFTVAHGLLYTPGRNQVSLSLLASSPVATGFAVDYMQVASTDATNVVVNFKLGTAAGAGTLCRIGIVCRM